MPTDDPREPGEGYESRPEESDEIDFEDAVSELERVESNRRRWGYVLGIGALVVLAAAVVVGVKYRAWLFQPKMPVEESRRAIIRDTDDPQCRTMIADVTNIANTYYALERRLEETVPGRDLEAIRKVDGKLATIEKRLDEAEALSREATLRFDKSRKELERWFSYVDNELRIVQEVTAGEIERLEAGTVAGETAGPSGDAGSDDRLDAGSTEPDAGGDSRRNTVERRDGALIALHDAFENFRVWHSAALHPCGDAAKDETPWRPDDWKENKSKGGGEGSTDE